MVDKVIDGNVYTQQVGDMTMSFKTAQKHALANKGYITDETNKIIAQAMEPSFPLFINELKYIGSGEDCFV
jgi:hypothetical protein